MLFSDLRPPLILVFRLRTITFLMFMAVALLEVISRAEVSTHTSRPSRQAKLTRVKQANNSADAEKLFAEANTLRSAWKAESFARAIYKYEQARLYWQNCKNQVMQAQALKSLGDVHSILSQYRKALDYYNRALLLSQTIGDLRMQIEVLNEIASISVDLGETPRALEHCEKARRLSKQIGDRLGEAEALNNIGLARYVSGDMKNALNLFHEALSIWETACDRQGQAKAINNIGYVHSDLGDIQKALEFFNRAIRLWQATANVRGQALSLTAIGTVYSWLGEKQEALYSHKHALQLFKTLGDRSGEAATLNGLGYVHDDLGDKHKALHYYNQALQIYRSVGNRDYAAITMGYVGRIYHSFGERRKALEYHEQKLIISRNLGDRRMEAYTLKDIGSVFDGAGDNRKALDYYGGALSISRSTGDRRCQAYTLVNMGYIYDKEGSKKEALNLYNEALGLFRAAEDRRGVTLALHNVARVKRDLGDLPEALATVKGLLETIESLRTKVISPELRASYFASVHQSYELYIDLLMLMSKQGLAGELNAAAFEASERARARSFLELLTESNLNIREGVDSDLLQRERALQQLLNAKSERQIRLLGNKQSSEDAAALRDEITNLTNDYREVKAQIRATSPHYAALTQPQPFSLSVIQNQILDADTMLLEYLLGDERSYLWAVTQNSITGYELPRRTELEAMAKRLYDLLTSSSRFESSKGARKNLADKQYAAVAANLSRMLLGPVATQLSTKRLVIVAEGILQLVPFAALPEPGLKAEDIGDASPLLIKHEVLTLPSISVLGVLRGELEGRQPAPGQVVVLADPVFDTDDSRVTVNRKPPPSRSRTRSRNPGETWSSGEKLVFQRLPFARQEATDIASLVPEGERRLVLDFEADRAFATSAQMGRYRIVHFATHALINDLHPELSGIVLSRVNRQGNPRDGFLRLHDVYNLKLPAELVVLSACETALGREIRGEGLIGLTRGFMYAGAARVLASLWKVDDRASAELMKHFYQGMLGPERLRPAAALQAAQIKMRSHERWKSPYYWAGFVLQGEWR